MRAERAGPIELCRREGGVFQGGYVGFEGLCIQAAFRRTRDARGLRDHVGERASRGRNIVDSVVTVVPKHRQDAVEFRWITERLIGVSTSWAGGGEGGRAPGFQPKERYGGIPAPVVLTGEDGVLTNRVPAVGNVQVTTAGDLLSIGPQVHPECRIS
jgi:hypothetical protein